MIRTSYRNCRLFFNSESFSERHLLYHQDSKTINVICRSELLSRKEIKGLPQCVLPLDLFEESEIIKNKYISSKLMKLYLESGINSDLAKIETLDYRALRYSKELEICCFFDFIFLISKLSQFEKVEFYFNEKYKPLCFMNIKWLLYLIENHLLNKIKVDFFITKINHLNKIDLIDELKNIFLSTEIIKPLKKIEPHKIEHPVCLLYLPALRHGHYFLDSIIKEKLPSMTQLLFVGDNIVRFSDFEEPFDFFLKQPITHSIVGDIFLKFTEKINKINVFESIDCAFKLYISDLLEKYLHYNYLGLSQQNHQYFDEIDISSAYFTDILTEEGIALRSYLKAHRITVDLLPHSFLTLNFLISPDSYRHMYTFFSMRALSGVSYPDNYDWNREIILPRQKSETLHKRGKATSWRSNSLAFLLYKLLKKMPRFISVLFFKKYSTKSWLRRLPKRKSKIFKIGILLNWEMYEFTWEQSIIDVTKWAIRLSSSLSKLSKNKIRCYFKPKPAYTQPKFFIQSLLENSKNLKQMSNIIFLSPTTPLMEFAKGMDLILCHQMTSAIVEIMEFGTACIRLNESDTPIKYRNFDDCFHFDETILPKLSLETLSHHVEKQSDFFEELAKVQQEWFLANLAQFSK